MWEHDFVKVKTTDEYCTYLQQLPSGQSTITASERAGIDFLDPRDGFFGGRTNAISLYAKADLEAGETIQFVDFTSLYPWTNKYCEYPLGHPEVRVDNFADISDYYGMAKCKVLPPRGLFYPVLPYRDFQKSDTILMSAGQVQEQCPTRCWPNSTWRDG
ncbi:Hypp8285 [Branchiostoma lanceolatum]|uniref:DNA-directed DNA polymerase n=1 Tax=Branchiostoma lanceolatum TaxID=7740 RepID=A0A8J9Z7J5_BRALA|nr:Hypp8285 [Branchiostoma lanceolatum]